MVEETEYILNTAVIDLNHKTNIVADTSGRYHLAKTKEGHESFYWKNIREIVFKQDLNDAYEKIEHWRLNLFMYQRNNSSFKTLGSRLTAEDNYA